MMSDLDEQIIRAAQGLCANAIQPTHIFINVDNYVKLYHYATMWRNRRRQAHLERKRRRMKGKR